MSSKIFNHKIQTEGKQSYCKLPAGRRSKKSNLKPRNHRLGVNGFITNNVVLKLLREFFGLKKTLMHKIR